MTEARWIIAAGLSLIAATAQAQTITAGDALVRIQRYYAMPAAADTVDTVKAGDGATPVTGIATTFLDTMDVLREAVRLGDNLIITHEPTFYNHRDNATFFTDDAVYKEKLAFIQQHHLVVFRLHDAIHSGPDDHILLGLYKALGWTDMPRAPGVHGRHFITVPAVTLQQLARLIRERLHIQTLRIEGDPQLLITHVAVLPGSSGLENQVLALRQPGTELLIAGEASEWETVEYVRDAVAQGRHKALILLGHQVSEEPGMEQCAEDLRPLFPTLHVHHIVAGQPLWNADSPPGAKLP